MPDVADPPPARIDYAPRPRLRRRLTRALKLTLLAAVSVAALYYAQPLWQRVMISRYVSKSAKDSVRPGEAVVLLNPSTAPVNLPQVLTDSYGFPYPKVYGRQHAPWLALRSELGLKPPGFLLPVFVNERTARDGTRWIVAVEFDGYSQFLFTLVECTPLWTKPRICQAIGSLRDFNPILELFLLQSIEAEPIDSTNRDRVSFTIVTSDGQRLLASCEICPDKAAIRIPNVPTTKFNHAGEVSLVLSRIDRR